jgi:hypothetical protein
MLSRQERKEIEKKRKEKGGKMKKMRNSKTAKGRSNPGPGRQAELTFELQFAITQLARSQGRQAAQG